MELTEELFILDGENVYVRRVQNKLLGSVEQMIQSISASLTNPVGMICSVENPLHTQFPHTKSRWPVHLSLNKNRAYLSIIMDMLPINTHFLPVKVEEAKEKQMLFIPIWGGTEQIESRLHGGLVKLRTGWSSPKSRFLLCVELDHDMSVRSSQAIVRMGLFAVSDNHDGSTLKCTFNSLWGHYPNVFDNHNLCTGEHPFARYNDEFARVVGFDDLAELVLRWFVDSPTSDHLLHKKVRHVEANVFRNSAFAFIENDGKLFPVSPRAMEQLRGNGKLELPIRVETLPAYSVTHACNCTAFGKGASNLNYEGFLSSLWARCLPKPGISLFQ